MGSMTRKALATPDIAAGSTDAEHLLSLSLAGAADVQRAALPLRLTQLVVARFDMVAVETAVFLSLCGAPPMQASQSADAKFHVHLRRVIDRYRLDCLFVADAPGQYHHAIRPRGYDYSVDAVHSKDMERGALTIEACIPYSRYSQLRQFGFIVTEKDHVWLRRVPCTWKAAEARSKCCAKVAPSRIGGA